MASYDIRFACGHEGTLQLVGPHKERERKIAYLQRSGSCPACYKAECERLRDAERAKASEASAQTNAEKGLPALIGTPKQVAWAETLRADRLTSAGMEILSILKRAQTAAKAAVEAGVATSPEVDAKILSIKDAGRSFVAALAEKTDAKYWIDSRGVEVSELVKPVTDAVTREMGALQMALKAYRDAAETSRRAEATARAAAEASEREEERARVVVKARTFRIDATPGREPAVVVTGANVMVRASDGRTAVGYIDDGEWAIYQIGDHPLSSTHPEMARIAREARQAWEARA